jgi:Extensin-like protein C-terminus
MHPSRLRLGPSQSRPLTDASPGSARSPGLTKGLPGSAFAPPEYPRSFSNRMPVLSSRSGHEVNDLAQAAVGPRRCPLTLAYTGQKLAEIETGPGFACTARYDKPRALPSEHAKGDAIDVMSFVLADRRRVTVKEPDPLVDALRMTACGYFTTVLGPDADP